MINDELEILLDRYIKGELNFTEYRQQRVQLLKEFIEEKKTDVTIPKNIGNIKPEPAVSSRSNSFNVPTIERDEPLSPARRLQITIVAGLIGLAIAAWLLSQNANINETEEILANAVKEKKSIAITNEPFIEAFIAEDVWDSESLSNFLLAWQNLSSERKELAKKSTSFKQMHKELKQKMNTASRLKNIGDKEAEKQEQLLIWFATQMSIGAV